MSEPYKRKIVPKTLSIKIFLKILWQSPFKLVHRKDPVITYDLTIEDIAVLLEVDPNSLPVKPEVAVRFVTEIIRDKGRGKEWLRAPKNREQVLQSLSRVAEVLDKLERMDRSKVH
jgi:hypothetical protein